MKRVTPTAQGYAEFVAELKQRIVSARLSAARAVNRDLILLYWDIGRRIVEKQKQFGWGKAVVESLAKDLQKGFPGMRGFSAANIWAMRRFFSEYGRPEFLQQLVEELTPDGSTPGFIAKVGHEFDSTGCFHYQLSSAAY